MVDSWVVLGWVGRVGAIGIAGEHLQYMQDRIHLGTARAGKSRTQPNSLPTLHCNASPLYSHPQLLVANCVSFLDVQNSTRSVPHPSFGRRRRNEQKHVASKHTSKANALDSSRDEGTWRQGGRAGGVALMEESFQSFFFLEKQPTICFSLHGSPSTTLLSSLWGHGSSCSHFQILPLPVFEVTASFIAR